MDVPGSLHGAVTRSAAVAALGQYGLRVAIEAGTLVPLWPRVVVDSARLLQLRTRAGAALLTVGGDAVVSGPTAARLHGCTAADQTTVHVLTRYDRRFQPKAGLRLHRGWYHDDDVTEVEGIPVLALDRAIADMLCSGQQREALASADQAMALHPSTGAAFIAQISSRLDRRRDRRGTKRATELLRLVDGRAESPPESWLRLLVVEAGFPVPDVQHRVLDIDGKLIYRLDLAWPELRIALEYDGYDAHAGRGVHDQERDADLARRGWVTVRATSDDLRNPRRLLDELAKAFGERRMVAGKRRPIAS